MHEIADDADSPTLVDNFCRLPFVRVRPEELPTYRQVGGFGTAYRYITPTPISFSAVPLTRSLTNRVPIHPMRRFRSPGLDTPLRRT